MRNLVRGRGSVVGVSLAVPATPHPLLSYLLFLTTHSVAAASTADRVHFGIVFGASWGRQVDLSTQSLLLAQGKREFRQSRAWTRARSHGGAMRGVPFNVLVVESAEPSSAMDEMAQGLPSGTSVLTWDTATSPSSLADRAGTVAADIRSGACKRVVLLARPGLDVLVLGTVLEVGVEAIAAGAGPAQEEEGGGDEPEAALQPLQGLCRLQSVWVAVDEEIVRALVCVEASDAAGGPGRPALDALSTPAREGPTAKALCEAMELASGVLVLAARGAPATPSSSSHSRDVLASRLGAMGRSGCVVAFVGAGDALPSTLRELANVGGTLHTEVASTEAWDLPPWARAAPPHVRSLESVSDAASVGRCTEKDAAGCTVGRYRSQRPFHPGRLHRLLTSSAALMEPDEEGVCAVTHRGPLGSDAAESGSFGAGPCLKGVLRIHGSVWLASRRDVEGCLFLCGSLAFLDASAPWSMGLEEDSGDAETSDSGRAPGQDLWLLLAEGVSWEAVKGTLDACLLAEETFDLGTEDPFAPWPTAAELRGDHGTAIPDMPDAGALGQAEEAGATAVDVDVDVSGRVLSVLQGGAEAQALLAGLTSEVAVVEWRAGWAGPSVEAGAAVSSLAERCPGVAFLRVDIEATPENESFAFDQVLTKSVAVRKDKPVLKNQAKFPCLSAFWTPALHGPQVFSGPTATSDLEQWLAAAVPSACAPGAQVTLVGDVASEYGHVVRNGSEGDGGIMDGDKTRVQDVPDITRGAADLQGMLRDAASGDQCVAVLWGDSGGAAGEVLKLDDLEVGFIKTIIATCDISKSEPNKGLGAALSVKDLPCLTLFRNMKVAGTVAGHKLTTQGVQSALWHMGVSPDPFASLSTSRRAHSQARGAGARAPARSPWDPSVGSAAVSGYRRDLGNGRIGYLWPRMPCLRCGCPWWTSEEWDALCSRCGWSCETEGYDDDSKPLPDYRATWEGFVGMIMRGRCPPWAPGRRAPHDRPGDHPVVTKAAPVGDEGGPGTQEEAREQSAVPADTGNAGGARKPASTPKDARGKGQWTKFY